MDCEIRGRSRASRVEPGTEWTLHCPSESLATRQEAHQASPTRFKPAEAASERHSEASIALGRGAGGRETRKAWSLRRAWIHPISAIVSLPVLVARPPHLLPAAASPFHWLPLPNHDLSQGGSHSTSSSTQKPSAAFAHLPLLFCSTQKPPTDFHPLSRLPFRIPFIHSRFKTRADTLFHLLNLVQPDSSFPRSSPSFRKNPAVFSKFIRASRPRPRETCLLTSPARLSLGRNPTRSLSKTPPTFDRSPPTPSIQNDVQGAQGAPCLFCPRYGFY